MSARSVQSRYLTGEADAGLPGDWISTLMVLLLTEIHHKMIHLMVLYI